MAEPEQHDDAAKTEVAVRSRKNMIGHDEETNPELEPLFANYFEMILIGTDLYLDIGIIRPEDILGLQSRVKATPSEVHDINFHVLQRVAMSQDGFERLRLNVDMIATALKKRENVAS